MSIDFNPEPDFFLRGHTHWPPFTDTEFIQLQFLNLQLLFVLREKLVKMCKLGCSFALVDDVFGLAAVGGGAARGRGCGAYFSPLLRFCSPNNSCRSRCTFLCNCSFSENSQAFDVTPPDSQATLYSSMSKITHTSRFCDKKDCRHEPIKTGSGFSNRYP